nr:nucleoside recognition domain-containing protein [uncultured Enterocloster sp.]
MENQTIEKKDILRFCILSVIGIFMYFIPVSGSVVPVVVIVNTVKKILGNGLNYVVLLALIALAATIIGSLVFKNEWCTRFLGGEKKSKLIHYLVALLVVLAVWFQIPPAAVFSNPDIGGQILSLAGTVMLTVSICGGFIVLILKSGIVEFVGTLAEPLMKPLFKLPGAAAINCLSSYVVSAAVGVYMTDQYYENGVYNRREAVAASTCFATISVGYVGVLCSLGGINDMYGTILGLTFVMVLVMTAITVRIPPICRIPAAYMDGAKAEETVQDDLPRLKRAVRAAALKSREFDGKAFCDSIVSALKFSQKIIAYMIPIVIVTLSLVHLTPLFTWLGKPIAPLLGLLGVPDAAQAAPAVLLGFIEVSLPTIAVSTGVAAPAVFFTVLLSICQIIFMTEAGNAMLGAKFKMSFAELILIFLVRTVIAAVLIAGLMHLLF